jgi:hypothetical protein
VNGPFSNITSGTDSNEANLDDMFRNGQPVRRFSKYGRTPQGYAQGFFVSYDTATTFKVTSGSAYINGEYRSTSTDITVPQTADEPSLGTSGIVSGAIAASTDYAVYLVADQDSTKTPSVSFGTSATGLTNYRLIGSIRTGAGSVFTSTDVTTVHAMSEREIVGGWINFNGVTNEIRDSFNVSSITDHGTGNYTITWDGDFNSASYVISGIAKGFDASYKTLMVMIDYSSTTSAGAAKFLINDDANNPKDTTEIMIMALGDSRK